MEKEQFIIEILDFYWINGEKENIEDLCLHGDVNVKIGEEIVADRYSCTVSSTALYLLKSIESDHLYGNEPNQMLPCCGFFIIPNEVDDTVMITGCPNGVDWSVIHSDNIIKLVTEKGTEVNLDSDYYRTIVFYFVDKVKDYYKKCNEKKIPNDKFDIEGYTKFWKEWNDRRNKQY